MTAVHLTKTSKFLSLVLRHEPEAIGLSLDDNGWADIDELIRLANADGKPVTRALIDEVVRDNDKQRFAISADGTRIRANQGHSIEVDLALTALEPPAVLYHGTATRFAKSIRNIGLVKQSRQHVHLSSDPDTATKVGSRHGKALVLSIRAGDMHARGLSFFQSENGIWLTDAVAPEFIDWPAQA
ncbi:RNA 2'-phosphotransferase [Lysobacter antibioticus]|uniref:Probable RNA 2'-phosphotransferase n=1 Tax=Lysobacter antibioticus TaxID=84531 RepID=A0A0S2F8F9_LYSAN|nr:RNA 2'-phosphotransferase [Lysobacter antibioticus]ALN79747.1 RNA 2'-phosphotransferase, Tpt1 / KptA family protein [Lysobacter antibioticus]